MKILLANEKRAADDYKVVTSFHEFMTLIKTEGETITDLRIQAFLLGLSCFFWLKDNCKHVAARLRYSVDLDSKTDTDEFMYFLRQFRRSYDKESKRRMGSIYRDVSATGSELRSERQELRETDVDDDSDSGWFSRR